MPAALQGLRVLRTAAWLGGDKGGATVPSKPAPLHQQLQFKGSEKLWVSAGQYDYVQWEGALFLNLFTGLF